MLLPATKMARNSSLQESRVDPLLANFVVAAGLQQKLLSRAFDWLKPGGKIVYCTCSLLPSEGEEQIVKFLQNHDDAKQLPANTYIPALPEDWIGQDGGLRLRPDFWADRGGMDVLYAKANQPVSTEEIVAAVWGDRDPKILANEISICFSGFIFF